jgi:putative FmdB family regulatory protein
MPMYEYRASAPDGGCEHCRTSFQMHQAITDEALTSCPRCAAPVERLLFPAAVSTPHTPSDYKNLGWTKMVRRDQGVYENLTATGDESRYMEANKPETMPKLTGKISD